jgi:acyl-CoA thioesterase-2
VTSSFPTPPGPSAAEPAGGRQEGRRLTAASDQPVAVGQVALDDLVALLDLERLELNLFRGVSPPHRPTRVFGGQVAGQALVAAGRTVEADRGVHSLHSYFVRPGDPQVPIVYEVERVRDGRSFATRRVRAVQRGETIFALSASFQLPQEGLDHTDPAPVGVPQPEDLPDLGTSLREGDGYLVGLPRPLDLRFVETPPWSARRGPATDEPVRVWMRADGTLPDDPLLHVCLLTYASDLTLLLSVLARHPVHAGQVAMASLDHAMWFHRPFRADEWLLYECRSPSASGARGLATGRFFSRDGRLVVTAVQEGMVRLLDGRR